MFPGSEHLISYHVITAGSCWAGRRMRPPIRLTAGDIIVFPHGDPHMLSSDPGMRATADLSLYRPPQDGQLPFSISMGSSGAESARFVCGFLGCDVRPYNPLLSALPRVIHVSDRGGALGGLRALRVGRVEGSRASAGRACSAA